MTGLEIGSASVIVFTACAFALAERVRPMNHGQHLLREGFADDLVLYSIGQSYVLGILIFSAIRSAAAIVPWSTSQTWLAAWPFGLQVVFFTITHDAYIYGMHRWQHSNKYLWRLHEAHHSCREVDWLSGSRSHALEILLNQTIEFAPIILLGADPRVIPVKGTVSAVWGMFIHANIDIKLGWARFIFNGPGMHRFHHSTGRGRNRNFSTKLALWDWLFGTAYDPDGECPSAFGLKTPFPDHFLGQFFFAFRRSR